MKFYDCTQITYRYVSYILCSAGDKTKHILKRLIRFNRFSHSAGLAIQSAVNIKGTRIVYDMFIRCLQY